MKRALWVGRFQPFHRGHLAVLKQLLSEYHEVIVAIGSAENPMTFNNPFSIPERIEMVRACLSKSQLARVIIIPVRDIHDHSKWVSHLKSYVPEFNVVYSNNELVATLFSRHKIKVRQFDLLKRERYQGIVIREKMVNGENWAPEVPVSVVKFIKSISGQARVKKLSSSIRSCSC